jgi:uncharacterized protein (TIGR03086 family)
VLDLTPATDAVARVVAAVRDDQLDAPTPCEGTPVAALLDHLDGLSQAFTAAARKTPLDAGASADTSRLADGWRERIPARLAALARAWHDEDAWTGMTAAGGVDLPGEVAGLVALDEVVVHGWDVARATDQDLGVDAQLVEGALGFVRQAVAEHPAGSPGLFGPPVPVADDAPPLHVLLGLTGRDPAWQPAHRTPPGG